MEDIVLNDFECPVCNEYLVKPIYQCTTGHTICFKCKAKLPECPYCKNQYGDTRNFILEGIVDKIKVKCKNEYCEETHPLPKLAKHASRCLYKPITCKVPNCNWNSTGALLNAHIKLEHKSILVSNYIILRPNQSQLCVVEYENHMFWVQKHTVDENVFWTVQMTFRTDSKDEYFSIIRLTPAGSSNGYAIQQPCKRYNDKDMETVEEIVSIKKNKFKNCKIQINIRNHTTKKNK